MSNPDFWLSRSEVRELDARAAGEFGIPSILLMENAGRGVAELLLRLNPERQPIAVCCGPGNNGGDGFVIARHLDNHGCPVHIWLALEAAETDEGDEENEPTDLEDPSLLGAALSRDGRINFYIAHRSAIPITVLRGTLVPWQRDMLRSGLELNAGWVVDALFGTGLRGELGPPFNEFIAAINLSGHPVLAVDIPSGLDCDEGEPLGQAVRATHTATFVAWKKGFLQPSAQPLIGEVHVIDISAPKKLVEEYQARRAAPGNPPGQPPKG